MPAAWELVAPPCDTSGCASGQKTTITNPSQPSQVAPLKFLAILVPHTGEVSSEWCLRLKDLCLPPGSQIFMSRGMPIDVTRESMVKTAMDLGFEWFLFLDSDVILPDGAVEKLFAPHIPLINGMYKAKKPNGFFWAVWMRTKTQEGADAFAPVAAWEGELIKCDVIGTGCMLIHRSVFETIKQKFPKLPLFLWTKERPAITTDVYDFPDPIMKNVSEDFYFCLLAQAAGFPIVVHTGVKCAHICTVSVKEDMVTLPGV